MSAAQQHRLLHRLQLAAHAAIKSSDRNVSEATGLTTAQLSVLAVIALSGAASQREVAETLGVNESAVTTMVRRLEGAGTVSRAVNPADRRAWLVELTPHGQEALAAGRKAFTPINVVFDQTLTPEEVGSLADMLTRLTVAFRQSAAEDGASR